MILLDTSVVSYLFRMQPQAAFYRERIRGEPAAIAFQTLEELLHGAHVAGWGARRMADLRGHIASYEVVWPDRRTVERCAILRSERRARGRALGTADAWVAATALTLGCPLASHDRDFSGIPGLEVIRAPR